MTDHTWRNLAEDAVNDLFKQYMADQFLAVVRQQMGIGTFIEKLHAAKTLREQIFTAIHDND